MSVIKQNQLHLMRQLVFSFHTAALPTFGALSATPIRPAKATSTFSLSAVNAKVIGPFELLGIAL